MRIAFDGSTLLPGRTGVGCYTEHLLQHLARAAKDDDLVVVSHRTPDLCAPLPAGVRVAVTRPCIVRLAWLQLCAPRLIREVGADVAHFTNGMIPLATPVPTVVTIHDMSSTLFPEFHPMRRLLLNRPLTRAAAHRADAVITVSHSAKRDITRIYGLDPDRVHVIHEAAAPHFRPVGDPAAREAVRRQYGLPERFILYVGAIEPRKNLPRLLEAFARKVHRAGLPHHLVCVGPYGWLSRGIAEHIAALGIGHAVHLVGYVPFHDLPAIYSLSDMFVFPSIYEGFGLPVLEAMACGTAAIVGRNSSLLEVGGDAVATVDPLDVDSIGEAMVTLARREDYRRDLSARGLERSRQFSWDRAAKETLAVYRSVAAAPARTAPEAAPLAAVGTRPLTLRTAPDRPILLGQAYYLRFDPKLWAAQQPYPPLGTLYAAAHLQDRGCRVAVFDAMLAESEADWGRALDREQLACAVIYEDSFNYLSKMCLLRMRQAAIRMIAMARARGIPVIVSGSDATDCPAEYLEQGATCVIMGEGEETLAELAAVFTGRRQTPLGEVRGLCFRDEHGALVRTPAREFIRDLDQLPFPAWDLVDVSRYRAIWRKHHRQFSMNLATTRGCPYHCNWCAKPIYGQRYAVRTPEHVAREFAWLKRTFAPDHIWIADDIFGLKPGWIEAFAAHAESLDAVIPFKCLMRADQVTSAVVAALTRAGCRTVWLGAESGSQRVLDAMDKGTRVDQIRHACRMLQQAGIEVGFFLQFGYPGEMRADIDLTLRMVRECGPDDIGVSVSYPLPGTRFYDKVRAELGQKRNWFDSSDLAAMYHTTYGPEFYRVLHRAVHAEFRLRHTGSVLRVARRPWRLRAHHVRQLAGAAMRALQLPLLRWQLRQLEQRPSAPPSRPSRSSRPDVGLPAPALSAQRDG